MTLFEPLFLVLALAAIGAVATALAVVARGQVRRAARILLRVAGGAGLYFGVVVLVAALSTRRVYRIGEPQCFDDWCIAVTDARRTASNAAVRYAVTLRLSSRALRVSQRERGAVVYLTDARHRRFDPETPGSVPFDTELQPGEAAFAERTFQLPADAIGVGLVFAHTGFPIGLFIIGENYWFHRPPIVQFE